MLKKYMKNKLTTNQRSSLLVKHKKERDKRTADRIKVILLYDDGWTFNEIAKALFIDETTARRHFDDYYEKNKIHPNHKGSKPLLNEEESKDLSQHLEENLYVKVKDVREYICNTYGKELGITTVYEWLKKHGFTYKKPKIVPAKPDPIKQAKFIKLYEKIMNEASLNDEPVLFVDAVHPSQQTRAAYGWVKKGKEKVLEVTAGRKRVNMRLLKNNMKI
jgi:transposase